MTAHLAKTVDQVFPSAARLVTSVHEARAVNQDQQVLLAIRQRNQSQAKVVTRENRDHLVFLARLAHRANAVKPAILDKTVCLDSTDLWESRENAATRATQVKLVCQVLTAFPAHQAPADCPALVADVVHQVNEVQWAHPASQVRLASAVTQDAWVTKDQKVILWRVSTKPANQVPRATAVHQARQELGVHSA